MKQYKQWILWKVVNGLKLPYSPFTLRKCNAHDPTQWVDYETAAAFRPNYGVAFVFTKNDPFFFLDIDKCLLPNSTWSPLANNLMGQLPGAFTELSQSNTGIHIIGKASAKDHACKNIAEGIELYTDSRFVALTEKNVIGDSNTDHTLAINNIIDTHFKSKVDNGIDWSNEPHPDWNGSTDDRVLISKALKTSSAAGVFGAKASFSDLWAANEDTLATCYPDPSGERSYDGSSADAALAQHLAFWTGNNHERILELMKQSALVRDKWEREDYLTRTITRAVNMQTVVYTSGVTERTEGNGTQIISGFQYLGADQQLNHFKGCVYVRDRHKILTTDGDFLKPEQFKVAYGGYTFPLDSDGKKDTRDAWEAFTQSQMVRYPQAAGTIFKPDLKPGEFVKYEGRNLVNSYIPIETPRKAGDAAPFLNHVKKLLPIKRDAEILLSYMAACIQHKGVKFQWAPLIQGVEGNGKTLFTTCVSEAVGRKYTHLPKASDMDNNFNAWIQDKLFIGVEDVYLSSNKNEVIESLKPLITNDYLPLTSKGIDQVTAYVCANFMLNSNHKDAIKKTLNDRRYAVFYTAQQEAEDLKRDGMDGDYFPNLYTWLRDGGYAIVNDYLSTYKIADELNPAIGCHRSPETSSTQEAITASLGSVEQEVMEAIEEGRLGFSNGWISSMALDKLCTDLKVGGRLPRNKRRDLLKSLGYDWHPNLPLGRVNNSIALDGGKPRLFIKTGHINNALTKQAEIIDAYVNAQSGTVTESNAKAVSILNGGK